MLLLQEGARLLGVDLAETQLNAFDLYLRELCLWNAKTNLIAESTEGEIVTRHFLDSLTAVKFILNQKARIVDIGCGAGFPGIPLKIALPSLQLGLLESNRKKVSFLKHMLRLLNLDGAYTLNDRTENIVRAGLHRAAFDIVISRAALKLPELIMLCGHFLAPDGLLIALKGPSVADEIDAVDKLKNGSKKYKINQYDIDLPLLGPKRKIILVRTLK